MKNSIKGVAASAAMYLLIISLIGGAAIYNAFTSFEKYFAASVDGDFIGYYKTEEDYVNTLKQCLAEEYEGEVKVTKFSPTHSPVFDVIYIKEKCISQVNNIELVNAKLTKEYTIYKIVENNVTKNYALTLDQAQLIVVKLRNEANKATAITIEPIIVTDLSLITDEAAIGGDIDLLCNDNLANYDVTKTEIEEALKNDEYIWPTDSTRITSTYGYRTLFGYTALHKGLDIGCPTNSKIYAMKAGTVVKAEYSNSYGWVVKIDHGDGMCTLYAHNTKLAVKVGDVVKQGETIAYSGNTGNSTGPHLHVEFIWKGVTQNPQKYI